MKIATWNVNSIRARLHILPEWLEKNNIDVLLIQEIKCENDKFPYEIIEDLGYNCVDLVHGQKSMNGVAIITKIPTLEVNKGLPLYNFGDIYNESRHIDVKVEHNGKIFRLFNTYFPNGSPLANYEGKDIESPRFSYKLDFFERYIKYINQAQEEASDEIFIMGGDYNIMHQDIDIYNPKNWRGKIAFTPQECEKMTKIIDSGFIDVFRKLNPELQEYTWWDYRSGGFPKNYGLRIDYMFISNNAMDMVKNCTIDRTVRALEKPSDHAPCILEII